MIKIKAGDKVRINNRKDWPSSSGHKMAGSEGDVVTVSDEGFITVHLIKTDIDWAKGNAFIFRQENVEKI